MSYLKITKDHPDLKILDKHLPFAPDRWFDSKEIALRSAWSQGKGEGHYIRTKSFRHWDLQKKEDLKEAIKKANLETKEVNFVFWDTSDYEVEFDNDRSWDAQFTFGVIKKENG